MVSQVQVIFFQTCFCHPLPNSSTKTVDEKNNHPKYGSTQVVLT